jgi:hypothetical protein
MYPFSGSGNKTGRKSTRKLESRDKVREPCLDSAVPGMDAGTTEFNWWFP